MGLTVHTCLMAPLRALHYRAGPRPGPAMQRHQIRHVSVNNHLSGCDPVATFFNSTMLGWRHSCSWSQLSTLRRCPSYGILGSYKRGPCTQLLQCPGLAHRRSSPLQHTSTRRKQSRADHTAPSHTPPAAPGAPGWRSPARPPGSGRSAHASAPPPPPWCGRGPCLRMWEPRGSRGLSRGRRRVIYVITGGSCDVGQTQGIATVLTVG